VRDTFWAIQDRKGRLLIESRDLQEDGSIKSTGVGNGPLDLPWGPLYRTKWDALPRCVKHRGEKPVPVRIVKARAPRKTEGVARADD